MRGFVVVLGIYAGLTGALPAQDSVPKPDSAAALPPPPTPGQTRYLQGLRTASRGMAQLKDGVDRVLRSRAPTDTARLRQAGSRLAGLCGAARGFIASGRVQMQATAYEDSMRLKARNLAVRIDSLIRYLPTCEASAARTPDRTAHELIERLRAYEASLRDFRAAIGLPTNR